VLQLTVADSIGELGGAQWLLDRAPVSYRISRPRRVTDIISARVRAGIVLAEHRELPGGGGWIVQRRVPGTDGLSPQVRLDPGTDPDGVGLAEAVAAAVAQTQP